LVACFNYVIINGNIYNFVVLILAPPESLIGLFLAARPPILGELEAVSKTFF
jgi:hypothetical protein